MDLHEAQDRISLRIRQTPTPPNIFLVDDDKAQPLPRWIIQNSAERRLVNTMEGAVVAEAEVVVRVETESGKFEKDNKRLVRLLLQQFKPGTRFDGVTIYEIPNVRPPMSENGVYATPVIIRGRFFQSP